MKVIRLNDAFFEFMFFCPGCRCGHGFRTKSFTPGKDLSAEEKKWVNAVWEFNGDLENPTLSPSYLLPGRCHCYITDGKIKFLNDSAHHLAGQTVDLPEAD